MREPQEWHPPFESSQASVSNTACVQVAVPQTFDTDSDDTVTESGITGAMEGVATGAIVRLMAGIIAVGLASGAIVRLVDDNAPMGAVTLVEMLVVAPLTLHAPHSTGNCSSATRAQASIGINPIESTKYRIRSPHWWQPFRVSSHA